MTDRERERYEDYKNAYAAFIKFYPFMLENLDGEQWADIAGYEGFYQISTFGRVKSFYHGQERIIKPFVNKKGYLIVSLTKNGEQRTKTVHKLVATTFISNPDNLPQVDHHFGMKFDNYVNNLRWLSGAENMRFSWTLGLRKIKLSIDDVRFIRENPVNLTQTELAKKFFTSKAVISAIQLGKKRKSAGGKIRRALVSRIPEEIRNQIRAEYKRGVWGSGILSLAKNSTLALLQFEKFFTRNKIYFSLLREFFLLQEVITYGIQ